MRYALILPLLLASFGHVAGDDGADREHMATKLEQRAEKLLSEGRRAEALELLVRAHDLRQKAARGEQPPRAQPARKKKTAAPKPDRPAPNNDIMKKGRAGPAAGANQALRQARQSMKAGNAEATMKHLQTALNRLTAWQKNLAKREQRLAQAPPGGSKRLQARLDRLEKEVRSIRKLLSDPVPRAQ